MIEELGRHGYKVSPGTMYPILHGLEKRISQVVCLPLRKSATAAIHGDTGRP